MLYQMLYYCSCLLCILLGFIIWTLIIYFIENYLRKKYEKEKLIIDHENEDREKFLGRIKNEDKNKYSGICDSQEFKLNPKIMDKAREDLYKKAEKEYEQGKLARKKEEEKEKERVGIRACIMMNICPVCGSTIDCVQEFSNPLLPIYKCDNCSWASSLIYIH